MHDSTAMQIAQGIGEQNAERNSIGDAQRPAAKSRGELFAIEPLHHQKRLARRKPPVLDEANDMRVIDSFEQQRFPREAMPSCNMIAVHHLDGDRLPRHHIQGSEHVPHAPTSGQSIHEEAIGYAIAWRNGKLRTTFTL